ncbi:hypothetical protein NXS19_013620 [Fusarium pseudograminearum]|nr:hypothetical protein NXS19_013620 [Fusarium pseudograminearum]
MDDGEPTLKLKFKELPYSVETDETEMISMNYVAASGGNAAVAAPKEDKPSLSIESNGKGKRRLVESHDGEYKDVVQEDEVALTPEEDEMIAALTAKANAIKMLQSRIHLLTTYLERLPLLSSTTMRLILAVWILITPHLHQPFSVRSRLL